MKTQILLLFLFVNTAINAQNRFESGYLIQNDGNRIECYIKNIDWFNNPTEIEYKLTQESKDAKVVNVANIKEFGIESGVIYKRFSVDLDMSSNNMVYMSKKIEPEFETRTLLLKQLVGGKANLYFYEGEGISRFFYKLDNQTEVKPLINKKYKITNQEVGLNAEFRSTLYYDLKCDDISALDSRKLQYDKKDLVEFFLKYNNCFGSESVVYKKNSKGSGSFNFKIKAGLASNKVKTKNGQSNIFGNTNVKGEVGSDIILRLGFEVEYILPFNNNKWSVFTDPAYQSYNNTGESIRIGSSGIVNRNEITVNYDYIEIPIGVKHFVFLNNSNKLFANAGFVVSIDLDGEIKFSQLSNIEVNSIGNLFFGIGYDYKNKYMIELRVATARNISKNIRTTKVTYSGISLNLGYTIF